MMTSELVRLMPWVGAQPYLEKDHPFFFGREREIAEVSRRAENERLTILTGSSGAGKTSLLYAGVVADLRARRSKGMSSGDIPSPTFVLRNWGVGPRQTTDDLFRSALSRALQDSPDQVGGLSLDNVLSQGTFFDQVVALCDTAGGVILIFDQFEEIMRAGRGLSSKVIDVISDLFRFERRARLLISLREEFVPNLRGLENIVGGLLNRTCYLEPLTGDAARRAVLLAAEVGQVRIGEKEVNSVLEWLAEWDRHSKGVTEFEQEDAALVSTARVDQLTLNAVFRELYEWCEPSENGVRVLDASALKRYRGGRPISEVIGGVLGRWVEKALTTSAGWGSQLESSALGGISEDRLSVLCWRIAARMAPFLSSAGYKVSAEQSELLYNAIGDDLRRLGLQNVSREMFISELRKLRDPDRIELEQSRLPWNSTKHQPDNTSGLARQSRWNPEQAALVLKGASLQTLHRLRNRNVVKSIHAYGHDVVWELVHDRIGRPFADWAESQRETWVNALSSLAVLRGADIIVPPVYGPGVKVESMNWKGCWIGPKDGEAVFLELLFVDCDLTGSQFENCTFRGGSFKNCVLDGTVFIDCRFEPGEDKVPVSFDGCISNSTLFLRGTMVAVLFKSNLNQLTFLEMKVDGRVRFLGGRVFQTAFRKLETTSSNGQLEFEGCLVQYSSWDRNYFAEKLMVRDPSTSIVNCDPSD